MKNHEISRYFLRSQTLNVSKCLKCLKMSKFFKIHEKWSEKWSKKWSISGFYLKNRGRHRLNFQKKPGRDTTNPTRLRHHRKHRKSVKFKIFLKNPALNASEKYSFVNNGTVSKGSLFSARKH